MSTDNSDPIAKVLLRQWLLDQMQGPVDTRVLELFGGMGHIYDDCYTEIKKHMAFELRKVDRPTWLQGDNRTLLRTRVNGWDLYDLDAYASPWTLANDICRMREDGRFAMALTCGIYRSLNTGSINGFVRQRIGLNGMGNETGLISRFYFEVIKLLMLDWQRWGVTVEGAKYIGSKGSHLIQYFGVVVNKDSSKALSPIQPSPKVATPPSKKTAQKQAGIKTFLKPSVSSS